MHKLSVILNALDDKSQSKNELKNIQVTGFNGKCMVYDFFHTLALELHMQKGHYKNKDLCIWMVERVSKL